MFHKKSSKQSLFVLVSFCFFSFLQNLTAANEIARLEKALHSGDFATVQELVPTPFDALKTNFDGQNLQTIAKALRDEHDAQSSYDQIAYYLGAENKNISTPILVFMRTNVKKLGLACLIALGLYVAKKHLDKNKSEPDTEVGTPLPDKKTDPIIDPTKGKPNPTPREEKKLKIDRTLYKTEFGLLNPTNNLKNGIWSTDKIHADPEGNSMSFQLYIDRAIPLNKLQPLYFYNKNEGFYQFTNFYPAEITIDGIKYPTTEHYFQAQKFVKTNKTIFEKIVTGTQSPRDAFDIAQKNKSLIPMEFYEKDNEIKVMETALRAKFTQHKDLHDLLLATENLVLVENTGLNPGLNKQGVFDPKLIDTKWGAGINGNGENCLGIALMKIRNELRQEMEQ
ncbi:MAG: NADAR family protein [Paludibacter sp.]